MTSYYIVLYYIILHYVILYYIIFYWHGTFWQVDIANMSGTTNPARKDCDLDDDLRGRFNFGVADYK